MRILCLLFATALLAAGAQAKKPQTPAAAPSAQASDLRTGQAMQTFFNIFKEVNLLYVDSTQPDRMVEEAAGAMLEGLDPYTEYIPASESEDFESMTTGKYAGIGAVIRQRAPWVEIAEPYRNTPADRAGLRAGDRIVSIDGASMRDKTTSQVSNLLRGQPGTKLTLGIVPIADTAQTLSVPITREKISIPAVPYYGWVSDSVGYIRLDSFTENCSAEVRKALAELKHSGRLGGLILDLRNNGGGILGEAVRVVSLFVPKGTGVVSIRGKVEAMNSEYKTTSAPLEPTLPLAVLINSSSASASEIVAGALQDLDRAVIVGQRSFGKGLVQTTRPVAKDAYVKITTAKYYIPSGRCIQALDYAHRNEDGSVGHIPDSLIREFKTTAGRKVYDGGGIVPDLKLAPQYYAKFTSILRGYGYIDDFANQYAVTHAPQPVERFEVGDSIYARFVAFMADKPIEFESATELRLNELRKSAEREKYASRIEAELAAIAEKIREDKSTELATFAPEIKEELTAEILLRWYYNGGAIRYGLKNDPCIKQTVGLLRNPSQYTHILTSQDTERK